MTTTEVIEWCRTLGVELQAGTSSLRIRARPGVLGDDLKAAIRERKAELIRLLRSACPDCGRPTDAKTECWRCHTRACLVCGMPTGSAYRQHCDTCGKNLPPSKPWGESAPDPERAALVAEMIAQLPWTRGGADVQATTLRR